MPASFRSLQRSLALLLASTSAFFPTSLPAASAHLATPSKTPGAAAAQGSASSDPISRLDQSARTAFAAGNGAAAVDLWQQAAEAARSGSDTLLQARLLSNISLALLLQGQSAEAQRSLEAAFALLDPLPRTTDSSQLRTRAQLLHTKARLHFERGQMQAALTTWRQVQPLYRELGAHQAELASLINQAEALHSLGNLSEASTLLNSLLQRTELSDQPRLKATALASLAVILQRQGELEEMRTRVSQLHDLAAASNRDPLASQQARLALANISPSHDNTQALPQNGATTWNDSLQARASLLALLISNSEYTSATKLWPKLLAEVNKLPGNAAALNLRLNLAGSLRRLREPNSALTTALAPSENELWQLLKRSKTDAERLGNGRASSLATGELGALALSANRLHEAETLSQQALRDSMSLKIPELSSRWLGQLGRILRQQNNRSAALAAYEQALKELSSLRLDLTSSSPAGANSFAKSLEPISREFIDLLTAPAATTEEVRHRDLNRARLVMEELQVAELNDFFRLPCFESSSIADSNQRDVAIVYPIALPNRLEVIVRLPGEKEPLHHSQPLTDGHLVRTVKILRDQLKARPHLSDSTSLQLTHAQKLHQWLFGNLERELQARGITQLVFVPDAALRNLPMSVLHDGKSFLSDRYAIAVAPGMMLTPSTRRPGRQPRVLGAGVSTTIPNLDNLPQDSLKPLPFVEREIENLRNRTGATTLLNQNFTKHELQKALASGDYSVVHLATHGQFSSNPNSTFLVTGIGELINANQLADFLQPSQRRTGNSLDLLILSACESANTDTDTNANLGLAAVAARSGASSTLASLWPVDDMSTAELMDAFYRHWLREKSNGQPNSKAKALSLAQADLRKSTNFSHPYYWAAFTLLGDWR
jgi:CHAT domain-containing protein